MASATHYRLKGIISGLFVSLLLWGCQKKHPQNIRKAFYYWKTHYHVSAYEQSRLDSFHCNTVYVRFFDISWQQKQNKPVPIAISDIKTIDQQNRYIPVIFITQQVIENIQPSNIEQFVKNFTQLLHQKCIQARITPSEIQIDLDWTKTTKDKYFKLLALCKKQPFFQGKTLSCTIRLHQLRYIKANGIPPVDRGLLMCYNMGDLKLSGTHNSILDLSVAKKYFAYVEQYPLPLDLAFPLFDWSLLYDQKNRFTGILRGISLPDLQNSTIFNRLNNNLYQVKIDTVMNGYHLQPTSTIRYESCDINQLTELAKILQGRVPGLSTLIFYHLDSSILSNYTNHELEEIYNTIH